jgi:hypothetical protein
MSIILSLQGSMAAGKTSAARYVEKNLPDVFVSYENPAPLLNEIKTRKLDKYTNEGFIEIQRLFINDVLKQWEDIKEYPLVLLDLGPEEVEFYTLYFPRAIGADWDVEAQLSNELSALRCCKTDGILFLDASHNTLYRNKVGDTTRKRGSFDFYIEHMLKPKKKWLASKEGTQFVNIDFLSPIQVGSLVIEWINSFIYKEKY